MTQNTNGLNTEEFLSASSARMLSRREQHELMKTQAVDDDPARYAPVVDPRCTVDADYPDADPTSRRVKRSAKGEADLVGAARQYDVWNGADMVVWAGDALQCEHASDDGRHFVLMVTVDGQQKVAHAGDWLIRNDDGAVIAVVSNDEFETNFKKL